MRIIKLVRLWGIHVAVLFGWACLFSAAAPAGAVDPPMDWPYDWVSIREFSVPFPELHRQCAIDASTSLASELLKPWEPIKVEWLDKPGHSQLTYRFTGPNSLRRFFDAGAIESWAAQDGTFANYLEDMDAKKLSKLFADHADGSQGWSPFVGTTDSFFASNFYSNKGDLLWVIKSNYGDSYQNPHNYARASTGSGEWERLFLHSIPEGKVQKIYRNNGWHNGGLQYELLYNRDPATGLLSEPSSSSKIMVLKDRFRQRQPKSPTGRIPCKPDVPGSVPYRSLKKVKSIF